MKKVIRFSLLVTIVVIIASPALGQDSIEMKIKGLPDSISWNLHETESKEKLGFRNYGYEIPDSWQVWTKPKDGITIHLVYVKVRDLGLSQEFSTASLRDQVEKMGYTICPAWAAVQLFLVTDYKGKAVWIPLREITLGEIPRTGCNHSKAHIGSCTASDLFPGDPRNIRGDDVIVLMRK